MATGEVTAENVLELQEIVKPMTFVTPVGCTNLALSYRRRILGELGCLVRSFLAQSVLVVLWP